MFISTVTHMRWSQLEDVLKMRALTRMATELEPCQHTSNDLECTHYDTHHDQASPPVENLEDGELG